MNRQIQQPLPQFKPGMLIPAWSPRLSIGTAGTALICAVSQDRRYAWILDADKASSSHLPPKRHDIVLDPRFGEKIVAYPDFLHNAFRIFRADKSIGTAPVPPFSPPTPI